MLDANPRTSGGPMSCALDTLLSPVSPKDSTARKDGAYDSALLSRPIAACYKPLVASRTIGAAKVPSMDPAGNRRLVEAQRQLLQKRLAARLDLPPGCHVQVDVLPACALFLLHTVSAAWEELPSAHPQGSDIQARLNALGGTCSGRVFLSHDALWPGSLCPRSFG